MKNRLEGFNTMQAELSKVVDRQTKYGANTEIISSFTDWVADLQMEGRMITPSKSDLTHWLTRNYPSSKNKEKSIWDLYSSNYDK